MRISEAEFAVLDTETTGLDPKEDRIVEFAVKNRYWTFDFLVNPGRNVPPEVSAIHHLESKDLQDAMPYDAAMDLIARLAHPDAIVCAHNSVFDLGFLPCLADRRVLCTKRLAQHLAPEMPAFNNQVLRYALLDDADRDEINAETQGMPPHRAKSDVIVTWHVLKKLIGRYTGEDVEGLLELAASPIRVQKFAFGKHAGRLISDVAKSDPSYLRWCLENMKDMEPDLRWTLQEELKVRR